MIKHFIYLFAELLYLNSHVKLDLIWEYEEHYERYSHFCKTSKTRAKKLYDIFCLKNEILHLLKKDNLFSLDNTLVIFFISRHVHYQDNFMWIEIVLFDWR